MKKVLHLFRTEKFTREFIYFMNANSAHDHIFWVFGEDYINIESEADYLKEKNVIYYPRIDIKLNKKSTEKQLDEFDLIIYHGVFENCIIEYFFKHRTLLGRLALYFWGGDKQLLGSLKEKLIKKYVIKNAAAIITIIPQDYNQLKKVYHPKGKIISARYYNEQESLILDSIKYNLKKENKTINIQIGNSATDTNNHIEVLDALGKFRNDNINIYLPLSYGDMEYAEKIIEYGSKIYGDKLIALKKFMSLQEYYVYLQKMDIAIFNMKRQQALGNINFLMKSGCKIFLNHEGLLWDFFVNDLNCKITKTDEIREMTFKQFIAYSENERNNNAENILRFFSKINSIKQWELFFSSF